MLDMLAYGLATVTSPTLRNYTAMNYAGIIMDPYKMAEEGKPVGPYFKVGSGAGDFTWGRSEKSKSMMFGGIFPDDHNFPSNKTMLEKIKANGLGVAVRGGGTALYVAQGYKEDGLRGAYDNLTQEMAVSAAINRWGYVTPTMWHGGALKSAANINPFSAKNGVRIAGAPLVGNHLMLRGVGSTIGSAIGQHFFGTPGAYIGAYIGAAPIQALRLHPVAMGLGAAVAAGALASYGAYSVAKAVVKEGYSRRQNLRGVNTDGDMSAFMTNNAFTMRQRAVQAISKSHLNARSALGQEANFMHMPYKNFHSRTRV